MLFLPNRRPSFLAMVIVAVFASTTIPTVHAADFSWLDSPEKAARLGRQLNLPVIMYITSDNCGYCRKMELESWANQDIAGMVQEGFVPLRVHARHHPELVTALGVRAFPTTILFSSQAKPIGRAAGYLSPPQLAALLRQASPSPTPLATGPRPDVYRGGEPAQPINWLESAQVAFQASQQSRRPIVIYVSSERCVYCRKMESEVWGDPGLLAMVQAGYIPLALKAESDSELIAALNVRAYPTTIVVSPERQVLAGIEGFVPVAGVAELLKQGDRQQPSPEAPPAPIALR